MKYPSESQIIEIWRYQLLNRTELATEEGEPLEIIYPGRINDDRGADFRDAVIATGGKLAKGDIEVHVNSSDWRAHRHHQDAVYNRVILHVALWHNSRQATIPQSGESIPVLALQKYIQIPPGRRASLESHPATPDMPCQRVLQRPTVDNMTEFLDRAGEERFLVKAARFQADSAQMGPSQSLYQGIMGALGYSKNKSPFLELARRLPLQVLEAVSHGEISDEECLVHLQALLLGAAGLLPPQRWEMPQRNGADDPWAEKLERRWHSSGCIEVMSASAWRLFKVRPHNSPVRRMVAMSYLLLRYRKKGIFKELVNMIEEAPLSKGCHRLEEGLLVATNGYWASHSDFGSEKRTDSPTLLGKERAADIIVNVLLPFTFAWGRFVSRPELERKAFDLYHHYPRLTANSVERHMKEQLGLGNGLVNSARRQQGLIHIYNNLCTQGRCHSCSLGQFEAGNHV